MQIDLSMLKPLDYPKVTYLKIAKVLARYRTFLEL